MFLFKYIIFFTKLLTSTRYKKYKNEKWMCVVIRAIMQKMKLAPLDGNNVLT